MVRVEVLRIPRSMSSVFQFGGKEDREEPLPPPPPAGKAKRVRGGRCTPRVFPSLLLLLYRQGIKDAPTSSRECLSPHMGESLLPCPALFLLPPRVPCSGKGRHSAAGSAVHSLVWEKEHTREGRRKEEEEEEERKLPKMPHKKCVFSIF